MASDRRPIGHGIRSNDHFLISSDTVSDMFGSLSTTDLDNSPLFFPLIVDILIVDILTWIVVTTAA